MPSNHDIEQSIESAVVDHYMTSGDFNGIHVDQARHAVHVGRREFDAAVKRLIRTRRIDAIFGDVHPNPAIKALPPDPIDVQFEKLSSDLAPNAWIYPTREALRGTIKRAPYRGRPFTRRLARGEHQFAFYAFDPVILYGYRDDPRYLYHNSDFGGSICVRDEFYESGVMYKRDQVLLKGFGVCVNAHGERAVAALLYDLSRLSPQHQQNWDNRRLKGDFQLHPMFWRWVCGHWPNGISIFAAMLQELKGINQLCDLMGKPRLFANEFDDRPDRFTFLLTPTLEEYNLFLQVLDKILVENMQEAFFEGDIEPFVLHERDGGVVERERKKPIGMLAEWLDKYYVSGGTETAEVIETFRAVRRLRNKPAHVLQPNKYDPQLFTAQRELMVRVFKAVRLLRRIFQTDGDCTEFKPPRFLEDGSKIWTI